MLLVLGSVGKLTHADTFKKPLLRDQIFIADHRANEPEFSSLLIDQFRDKNSSNITRIFKRILSDWADKS